MTRWRRPDMSVLMPAYNATRDGGSWLRKCIESILDQTHPNFEFLIVDDGSTDDTPDVLAEYAGRDQRIRLLSTGRNSGITVALNLGLSECRADLVARQDADDFSAVTRLGVQLAHMMANPHLSLVGSDMLVVDEEGRVSAMIEKPRGQGIHDMMPRGCPLAHGSVMFQKHHVMMLGGYDPKGLYPYAEDYHLWARMHMAGLRMDNLGKPLYYHRNHPTKSSVAYRALQSDSTRRIMEMLAGSAG